MKTVLIIEDNFEIRDNTAEQLELEGFNVIGAGNGREGIAMAVNARPDLILCDIMMPEMNGYEVIRELKDNDLTASIPFIYVTASGEKSEIEMAMGMGANGFIRKPFDPRELMQLINKWLR